MSEDTFAFRLKVLLQHKKFSLQQVADAVGISRPAVHKWTRGGEIDYSNLRRLAAFLDVNWVWLRYGDDAVKDLGLGASTELPMTDLRRSHTAEIVSNEARMRHAQEAAGIVTWEWNLVTDELIYSSNCAKQYGREIHSNEEFWEILHPDEASWLNSAALQKVIASNKPHVWDFRILLPDGKIRWIESHTATVRDDAGRPIRMVGTTIDISIRKETELALRSRIQLLSDGERLAGRGTWQWQPANDELLMSDACCKLFGLDPITAPRHYAQLANLVHPDDQTARQTVVADALARGSNYRATYRAILPDGTSRLLIEQGYAQMERTTQASQLIALCRTAEPADAAPASH